MTQIAIRKSGGANIISIPKAVLDHFGLQVGSLVELSVEDDRIILTPESAPETLDALLAGSPKELLALTEEDQEWLNSPAIGKEVFN